MKILCSRCCGRVKTVSADSAMHFSAGTMCTNTGKEYQGGALFGLTEQIQFETVHYVVFFFVFFKPRFLVLELFFVFYTASVQYKF